MQCIEAGFFDALETIGEPTSAELISKKFGYDVVILERLLNALISYKLILAEKNKKGKSLFLFLSPSLPARESQQKLELNLCLDNLWFPE